MTELPSGMKDQIVASFNKHSGNITAVSREVGCSRSSVRRNIAKAGIGKKPLAGGKRKVTVHQGSLPKTGGIKRYIITSAQNNTYVHPEFWENVLALVEHYGAELLVGTYSYNQNNYGKLAVKAGTKKPHEFTLWFDPVLKEYIAKGDRKIELAPGLTWIGTMNILPTEDNPISGLESHGGSSSVIFPHAKVEMRSIAMPPDMPVKMIYTTGTVTQMNYLQKKLGIKAEHHHRYSVLIVEVDSKGNWWVRQVSSRKNGKNLQDLNVVVEDGQVISTKAPVAAIAWGDLHATRANAQVVEGSQDMLDTLHPQVQYIHDLLEGISVNPHMRKYKAVHEAYVRWLRGLHRVEEELKATKVVLDKYLRPWVKTVVPDANHDRFWLQRWLREYDYRVDPPNTAIFLRLQKWFFDELIAGKMAKNVNLMEQAFVTETGLEKGSVKFLLPDETSLVGDVAYDMHGHRGPNGAEGAPGNLSKIGRKATTMHTHVAGIYHGLFVGGTSSELTQGWDYTSGPSAWSHSHVAQYANGQRTVITMKIVDGVAKWCAEN
jgi:hypothetical protein